MPIILALRIGSVFANKRSLFLFSLMQMRVFLMVPQWHWDLECHWEKKIWKHKQVHVGFFAGPLCFLLLCLKIQCFLSSGRNSIILPLLSGKICFHVLWNYKAILREWIYLWTYGNISFGNLEVLTVVVFTANCIALK